MASILPTTIFLVRLSTCVAIEEEEEDCDERPSYDGTRTTIPLEQPKKTASPVLLPVAHLVLIIGPCCALLASVKYCIKRRNQHP